MDVNEIRRSNLLLLQEEASLDRKDVAARLGMDYGQLGHYFMDPDKEGHRNISDKIARRIETAFQKPRGWLDHPRTGVVALVEERQGQYEANIVPVRVFEARASAGPGTAHPEHDTIVGRMELSKEWVRRNLPSISSATNLAVLTAYGDSMEPTFRDGDILLVDRGVDQVRMDAVYVLSRDGELFVKRVQRRLNGDLVIKSDNPLLDPETVAGHELGQVHILGRVVWSWNGKRL